MGTLDFGRWPHDCADRRELRKATNSSVDFARLDEVDGAPGVAGRIAPRTHSDSQSWAMHRMSLPARWVCSAIFIAMAMIGGAFADTIAQYAGAGSGARDLFPGNDLLDWGQLGPPCPPIGSGCVPNGSVANSANGIGIEIFSQTGHSTAKMRGRSGGPGISKSETISSGMITDRGRLLESFDECCRHRFRDSSQRWRRVHRDR
jgi:hypothetical protein